MVRILLLSRSPSCCQPVKNHSLDLILFRSYKLNISFARKIRIDVFFEVSFHHSRVYWTIKVEHFTNNKALENYLEAHILDTDGNMNN